MTMENRSNKTCLMKWVLLLHTKVSFFATKTGLSLRVHLDALTLQELKGFGKSASPNSRSSWMNMQDYIQISENREKNYLDSEGSVGLKMMPKHQGKFQTLTFQIV